ncbi:MAG: hypothetical protein AAF736_04475 [Pseudomonadota bacterium]
MPDAPTICLVSPGHFSSNPRLVKELTALHRANFSVRTVTSAQVPWFAELDEQMDEPALADGLRLSRLGRLPRILLRLRQKSYRAWVALLFRLGRRPRAWHLAEALNPDCRRLRNTLRRQNADASAPFTLAIAHNLAALPAAATVARETGAGFAFDAEDSHVDELDESQSFDRQLRQALESAYLPDASYVSAASPGIANALTERYGLQPTVLLNVFSPNRELPQIAPPLGPGDPIRFFWFSQTIGPDRGLDGFLALAPRLQAALDRPLELTLVGRPVPGFDATLRREAQACGVELALMPLLAPEALFELAAGHHCGLALEHRQPVNKDICLANKIFTYLAAGLPTLLTPTAAHLALAPELTEAVHLLDDPPVSEPVSRWLEEVVCTGRGHAAALRHFSDRFNWDLESKVFLKRVKEALAS